MMKTFSCDVLRDDIIALLYNDGDPVERARARDHLAECVQCRGEFTELKGVRKALGGWSLPSVAPITIPKRARWIPTALSVAAGLILGLGAAVAGRSAFFPQDPRPDSQAVAQQAQFVSYEALQELLSTQESRHQAEVAELRRVLATVVESPAASIAAPLRASNLSPSTIEKLLRASEERQARMIEARLAGLKTENDLQRQYDMAQIAAGLAYIDSRTGAEAARTSELMKNLVRVTAKPPDR